MLIRTSNAGSMQYVSEGVLFHQFESLLPPEPAKRVLAALLKHFLIDLTGATVYYSPELKGFMLLHGIEEPTYLIMRPLQILINVPTDGMALLDLVDGRYGQNWPFVNRITGPTMQGGEGADYCLEISRLLARLAKLRIAAMGLDTGEPRPNPIELIEIHEIRADLGALHRVLVMYRDAIEKHPIMVGSHQREDIYTRMHAADMELRAINDKITLMQDLYPTARSERWPTPI